LNKVVKLLIGDIGTSLNMFIMFSVHYFVSSYWIDQEGMLCCVTDVRSSLIAGEETDGRVAENV